MTITWQMCGIAGAYYRSQLAPNLALEPLRHRGPDAEGQWRSADGTCVLGHTRLAILDLSPAGNQPMHDETNGNCIVFNGEIYNHLELRLALKEYGPQWRSSCDTETLLVAYRCWGVDCLKKLRGMFAFAIFDAGDGSVFIARDRLGIKPLYWLENEDGIRFCSELRPLWPEAGRAMPAMLGEFLRWGCCPDEEAFSNNLRTFPAGKWMRVRRGGPPEWGVFWPPESIEKRTSQDSASELRRRLETAVQTHLLSDVPVACFLSGGIDSSIIAALAAKNMPAGRLITISLGFPGDQELDETRIAAEVAKRWHTEHCRTEVGNEEALHLVEEAVSVMDCPSVDALNTYIVAKQAAKLGVKIALVGLGGDELFGGYPSFREVPLLRYFAKLPRALRTGVARFIFPRGMRRRLDDLPAANAASLTRWRRQLFSEAEMASLGLPSHPAEALPAPRLPDDFSAMSWQELAGYTRPMLLRDADQMAMAVSLELRTPLLDHELVEYVLSLPCRLKQRPPRPKGLLVSACRDLLPPEVYKRPKMGFSLPMDRWLRGPLAGFCEQGLAALTDTRYLNAGGVLEIRERFEKRTAHWSRLWALVVLGHYLERNRCG